MSFFLPGFLCADGLLPLYLGHKQEARSFMKTAGNRDADAQPAGFFSRWQTQLIAQFWHYSLFSLDL
jgi:hypothetical protein